MVSNSLFERANACTHTHTHTHTHRKREKERERMNARTIDEGMNAAETLSVSLSLLILARACFFLAVFLTPHVSKLLNDAFGV